MEFIQNFIRKLPLIKGLADCSAKNHFEAIQELSINLMGALAPLLIGFLFIVYRLNPNFATTEPYIDALIMTISNGELLLYSTSFLAPIIYLATAGKQGGKEFPTKRAHLVLVFAILIFSTATFAFQKAGLIINSTMLFKASCFGFLASILLFYLAITYKNRMITPEDMKQQENDYNINYKKHRPGGDNG